MPHQHDKKGGLFSKIAAGCGLVVAGLGIAGLSGWLLGWLFLSSLGKNIIPMAPSSAFLLILMGSALYLHGLFPNTRSMYGV